jgi:small subunit ribosomal protein S20
MAEDKKEKKEKKKRPTALKRDLQNEKRRLRNRQFKTSVRTEIRKLKEFVEKQEKDQAKTQLNHVYSLLDKGVKNGNYKLNAASRTKSRLAAIAAA